MQKETNKSRPRHVLFIMVDGLGIPGEELAESVYSQCPALCKCIREHSVSVDATLGLPGAPQSATGQTAIFTGINAAELLGRHVSGFPNAQLRKIVEKENIFHKLMAHGLTATFANAYARYSEQTLPKSLRSVTTVATLSAFNKTRTKAQLEAGKAVYHDLTRRRLVEHGRLQVPIITEETAADHLLEIMRTVDFCLFEYFLTDHAGHRGTEADKRKTLASLDRFFAQIIQQINPEDELFAWTSDHGNIENQASPRHTRNPVPFCTYGWQAEMVRSGLDSILQVADRLEDVLTGSAGCGTNSLSADS